MPTTMLDLQGVTSHTEYRDGTMRDCVLAEPNVIHTSCGDLVPHYDALEVRTKPGKSMTFFKSGAIRSVALEEQAYVTTPLGPIPAELVTFYENGTLNSVFPLNGQISYAWSEEEEKGLAVPMTLKFTFGQVTAKFIALRFRDDGQLRSVTLWPGEVVTITTPLGEFPARTGIRLHPNGALESFEPAQPIVLDTPIGKVPAYDVDAFTVDGDQNSVRFDEDGNLTHLTTAGEITVEDPDQGMMSVHSRTRFALMEDVPVNLSIDVSFDEDQVSLGNGAQNHTFSVPKCSFTVNSNIDPESLVVCDSRCETGGNSCDSCEGNCNGSCK